MQKIVLKIYIKQKRRPLCVVDIPSIEIVDSLMEDLTTKSIIKFGQIIFKSEDFTYATIEYK